MVNVNCILWIAPYCLIIHINFLVIAHLHFNRVIFIRSAPNCYCHNFSKIVRLRHLLLTFHRTKQNPHNQDNLSFREISRIKLAELQHIFWFIGEYIQLPWIDLIIHTQLLDRLPLWINQSLTHDLLIRVVPPNVVQH